MAEPSWIVKEAEPLENYTLLLRFADGSRRVYNVKPLLEKAIYSQLKSLPFFMKAKVDGGTVVWNDNVDIAPEHLYECSALVPAKGG